MDSLHSLNLMTVIVYGLMITTRLEMVRVVIPIIADPEGTDLNQAWIAYKSHGVKAKLGRQRILHGSQRFVGGVACRRQNEQTYDGVRFEAKPIDGLSLDVAFVSNINRIFGPEDGVQPSDWQGDNVFLRSQYTLTKFSLCGWLRVSY